MTLLSALERFRGRLRHAVRLDWQRVLIIAIVVGLSSAGAEAATLGKPGYRGEGQGGSTVAFRVIAKHGKNSAAVFKAENVELFCEDLTQTRVTLDPVKVPFKRHGRFHVEIYSLEQNGDESFYEVDGRLRSRERATGSLHYVSDPVNPPGSGAPSDCDSLNVIWKAKRVH